MPTLFLVPFATLYWLITIPGLLLYFFLYLFTSQTPVVDLDTQTVTWENHEWIQHLQWYYIFGKN